MTYKALAAASCLALGVGMLSAQTPADTAAESFYAAIRSNDLQKLQALIQGGADVNVKERRGGATPIMHAAAIGSLDAMKLLIDKGADVNARGPAGASALMWAVTDLAKVRLLLDRGARVNAASELGRTPLLLAAMSDGSSEIVKLLLARGADPKVVDKERWTTTLSAAYGNDTGTLRQLIAAGADVNSAWRLTGQTPLMMAAGHGNRDAVRLLLEKGANVNAVSAPPGQPVKNGIIDIGNITPLMTAVATAPADVVKRLLDAGANVNAVDARGMSPLVFAIASDHSDPEVIPLLLARGADVHLKTRAGETATDWAFKSGSTTKLAALKGAGGMVTARPEPKLPSAAPTGARAAIERSVPLMEQSSGTFFKNGACGACHAQNITDIAVMRAKAAGVRIDEAAATQRASGAAAQFSSTAPRFLERQDGPTVDIPLYTLNAFASAAYPPDRATDALMFSVLAQQRRDGSWHLGGIPRPPMEDGDFFRTALAVRAMKAYGFPGRAAEINDRLTRAMASLQSSRPVTMDDRTFRLLGLKWGGADSGTIQRAAREIVALQQADGGWGQKADMASDPYATGLTLYTLLETGGLTASSEAAQKATRYLLNTQRADGSWYVRSRSPKFQPYFDGGFPYDHDQWISSMATGWATAALAAGLQN
jgi:ankyrin repeat protein